MLPRPKLRLRSLIKPNFWIIALLLLIGLISLVYADGLTMIYQTWNSLTAPRVSFIVRPEKLYLPADGISQLYIDVQVKDRQDQLINGAEITATIINGETVLTDMSNFPTDLSKRVLVQAPQQPQAITLSFRYQQLIKTISLEAFDPTPPLAPIIKAPIDRTVFTTATPIVSGEAPPNTKVEIYIDGVLNTVMPVDESGQFAHELEAAVKKGLPKLAAATMNKYGTNSSTTPAISIEIRTPDPEIDLLNLRIKPNPVTAGKSFQFFVPVSGGTKEVTLLLDNQSYALLDTNNSSVFSGNIPAPYKAGLYQISLIITTKSGDKVIAEKIAPITVN